MKAWVSVDIKLFSTDIGFFLTSSNVLECSSVYFSGELMNYIFESCEPFLQFSFNYEIIVFKAIEFFKEEDVREHYNDR